MFMKRNFTWCLLFLGALMPTVSASPPIQVVSAPGDGLPANLSAGGNSFALGITPDGSFALFASVAANLVPNGRSAGYADLYLWCRTNDTVSRVSANAQNTGGANGDSVYAAVTPNGRYVVFQSAASNLVTNDANGASDVFLRDMAAGTTQLVSLNSQGTASGNGASSNPVITPDGRFVAFVSSATDLVDREVNGIPDIFVRDMLNGVTTLASPGAQAGPAGPTSASETPAITPDGRFVAFTSTATNLVADPAAASQEVYVRDLVQGQTFWASQNVPAATSKASYAPVLSDDGRYAAFKTFTNNSFQIYRCALPALDLDLVSTNADGLDPRVADDYGPAMSPAGRFVVFTEAVNSQGASSVWRWDGQTKTASLVSADANGAAVESGRSDTATLSPDGRYVAFLSNSTNLVSHSGQGGYEVFLRDMQTQLTTGVTMDPDSTVQEAADDAIPNLSSDGRFVSFDSRGDTLVPQDFNHASDAFVRDLSVPMTELISRAAVSGPPVTGDSGSWIGDHAISADGRYVVFESLADDLVPGDTNGYQNVFVRDLQSGSNVLVSVNQSGTGSAHGPSYHASISANGRCVVFTSVADDLAPNKTNKAEAIFVRDLLAQTTRLVSVNADGTGILPRLAASISADGRFAAFEGNAHGSVGNIYVRDLMADKTRVAFTNSPSSDAPPLIGPDGRYVAFQQFTSQDFPGLLILDLQTGSGHRLSDHVPAKAFSADSSVLAYTTLDAPSRANYLVVTNLALGTNFTLPLGVGTLGSTANLARFFSRQAVSVGLDGRWVAISSRRPLVGPGTNDLENVFICDVPNANLVLASVSQTGTAGGNGSSDSPRLSNDGRYVAFRSAASNLVADDDNNLDDTFLFDRLTGQTTLLSRAGDGFSSAHGSAVALALAPDAQRVVFTSAAPDLVGGDGNDAVDVFTADIEPAIPGTDTAPIQLSDATRDAGVTTIHWIASLGRSYRVEYRDSLETSRWQDLPGVVVIVGASAWMTDATDSNLLRRFYRVRQAP